ncbi:hypothetical protein YC2023_084684 [Brassica napus]
MVSKELSPEVPKKKDDPKTAIQEILKITNNQNKRLESVTSSPDVLVGQEDSEDVVPKLQLNLRKLNSDLIKLQERNEDVGYEVRKHFTPLNSLLKKVESSKHEFTKGMKKELGDINTKMFNLMTKVPMLPNKGIRFSCWLRWTTTGNALLACLPGIHANDEDLRRLVVYRDVKNKFKELMGLKEVKGETYMWEVNLVWRYRTRGSAKQRWRTHSFVWLLMAHFGLGDQFQINQGGAITKLIISKPKQNSPLNDGKIIFRDTLAETGKFCRRRHIEEVIVLLPHTWSNPAEAVSSISGALWTNKSLQDAS